MKKNTDEESRETGTIKIRMPKVLMNRVNRYCKKADLSIETFVLDAITDKLEMVHKERRRRPRL